MAERLMFVNGSYSPCRRNDIDDGASPFGITCQHTRWFLESSRAPERWGTESADPSSGTVFVMARNNNYPSHVRSREEPVVASEIPILMSTEPSKKRGYHSPSPHKSLISLTKSTQEFSIRSVDAKN